jgi:hypothetical protein
MGKTADGSSGTQQGCSPERRLGDGQAPQRRSSTSDERLGFTAFATGMIAVELLWVTVLAYAVSHLVS